MIESDLPLITIRYICHRPVIVEVAGLELHMLWSIFENNVLSLENLQSIHSVDVTVYA